MLIAPWELVPAACRGTYRVAVTDPENIEMYRVPLRDRLPTIRIPLRAGDRDVSLSLQALIDAAYENGGYDDVDYRGEPEPPLWREDADWANELLLAAKRR